jgi:protein phosphatase PTC7
MLTLDSQTVLKSLSYIEQELKKRTNRWIPSQRRKSRGEPSNKQEQEPVQKEHESLPKQLSIPMSVVEHNESQGAPKSLIFNNSSVSAVLDKKDIAYITGSQTQNKLKVFTSAAFSPKRPNKTRAEKYKVDCGEDAFFVCHSFPNTDCKNARICCFGVADGVGGYSLRGIDSSMLAWELMKLSKKYLERDHETTCIEALTLAYNEILESKTVTCGGSTACILSINYAAEDKQVLKLTAANLGDSSFLVVRNGKVLYHSYEQTHFFNCPYQLTVPKIDSNPLQDDPTKAIILDQPIDLIKGDVVILCTDGLTDNVFDSSIAKIVSNAQGGTEEDISAHIAKEILLLAFKNSRSRNVVTPFMKYASENGHKYRGGKQDDITIIVALIA